MKNKNIRKWLLFGVVTLVIILAIELCVIRILDHTQEKESLLLNVAQRPLDNIDETQEQGDATDYSSILGRKWTKEEEKEQKVLEKQSILIMCNNLGVVEDFMLPNGNWFLNEDLVCIYLREKKEDGTAYNDFFSVENEDILNTYREYWTDTFYSYDKNTKEMIERYRYYQLVFESFYLDDKNVIPEKVCIYKVENILPEGAEDAVFDVTDFALVETMEFEVSNTEGMKHYEIAEQLDMYNITDLSYAYTCDGVGDYSVMRDCTLNGKVFSLEQRKALLEDGLNETYTLKKRDLLGLSNYYYRKVVKNSQLLGGEVTAIVCEQNIFYRAYLYLWKIMVVILVVNIVASVFITVIVAEVQKYKKNKASM